jgi:aspartate beta-hydroxylase
METNRNAVAVNVIENVRNLYNSQVKDPAYLQVESYFPEYKILEDNWEIIKSEIIDVISETKIPKFHEIDNGQDFISNNDGKSWNILCLKMYGMWNKTNAKKCPKTAALLKSIKHVTSINFSILAPGKYIPPHKGPYKGIIRYQLPLEVPKKGSCFLVVDGKYHYWQEGKSVLFDDTYTHEVHNDTNERRIALLLDVKRKNLTATMKVFDWFYYKLFQSAIYLGGGLKKSKVK